MPTLPSQPEPPAGPLERGAEVIKRAGAAIGADGRVTLRALLFMAMAVAGAVTAPHPWDYISVLGIVGLVLEIARGRPVYRQGSV